MSARTSSVTLATLWPRLEVPLNATSSFDRRDLITWPRYRGMARMMEVSTSAVDCEGGLAASTLGRCHREPAFGPVCCTALRLLHSVSVRQTLLPASLAGLRATWRSPAPRMKRRRRRWVSLLGLCWSAAGRAEVHVLVVLAEAAAALLEGVDVAQLHSHSPLARPERLQPAPKAVRCDGSGTCRGTVSDPGGAIAEDEVELVLSDVSVELLELVDRSQSGHVTSAFGLAPRMLRQAEEAGQLPRHVVDAEGDDVDHVVGLLTQFLLGPRPDSRRSPSSGPPLGGSPQGSSSAAARVVSASPPPPAFAGASPLGGAVTHPLRAAPAPVPRSPSSRGQQPRGARGWSACSLCRWRRGSRCRRSESVHPRANCSSVPPFSLSFSWSLSW